VIVWRYDERTLVVDRVGRDCEGKRVVVVSVNQLRVALLDRPPDSGCDVDRAIRCDRSCSPDLNAVDDFVRWEALPVGARSRVGRNDSYVMPAVSKPGC
jgi:hypothetical protein